MRSSTSRKRLDSGQTDIPRLREGGVKAQFWSVYIPSEHENPARTVTEQIDLVHRLIEKYPADLELALTADDVEPIVKSGKIASLIGIEGGVAIENSFAQLRAFHQRGRLLVPPAHRGAAAPRLFRVRRAQDSRRQHSAGVPRGRQRGPAAAAKHATGG